MPHDPITKPTGCRVVKSKSPTIMCRTAQGHTKAGMSEQSGRKGRVDSAVRAGNARSNTHMIGQTKLNEHLIRLRGGWECRTTASGMSLTRRFTLPTRWANHNAERLTLTRRFGRPAFDPDCADIWLRMDHVAGMHCLELNGQPLVTVSPTTSQYDIPLPALSDRNQLDIEVDVKEAAPRSPSPDAEWGLISLVIRSRGDQG